MAKRNIKVSKQIHTAYFFGIWSSFRFMFFIRKTLLLFDIKANQPFRALPNPTAM